MGPLISAYRTEGYLQPRLGSGIPYTVPRNTYRTADDVWVAVSTSADTVAARVMAMIGFGDDERFASFAGRVEHRDEIDDRMAEWIGARSLAEVVAAFEAAEAAVAPVFTMADIDADPHYRARGTIADVDGVPMPGLIARLSATPGHIRWPGRPPGADTTDVLSELPPPPPEI
jgi:crotonobetainyl-CoA:carnitine CoA-transferase CaiB-like acyl-CoA transferase